MPGLSDVILSPGMILTLARRAGFSSTRKVNGMPEDRMAVAISLGESGGNYFAHNKIPPDDSYGLWQINMLGSLGPARRQQFGIEENEDLFDPLTNARAAHMVFVEAGNSFRPWSVYTSGSWMRHRAKAMNAKPENLPEGSWADDLIPGTPGVDDLPDVPNPLDEIQAVLSFITDPNNWKRVALFIGGGIILVIALIALMDKLGAGKAVGKVVTAMPAGRVAKAAAKRVS